MKEWCELSCVSIPHFKFIRSLCPNYLGIRQLVIDDAGMGYIFSPATGSVVTIPEFPASADVTFWDQQVCHYIKVFMQVTALVCTYIFGVKQHIM